MINNIDAEIPFEPQQAPLDPSQQSYWDNVKTRARLRKAKRLAQHSLKTMRLSQVYEQYVYDCCGIVSDAMAEAKITAMQEIITFRADCAEWMQLPELADLTFDEIAAQSAEAVTEARRNLYGHS